MRASTIVDRPHSPAEPLGARAWLQPSDALTRFDPPEALRLQAASQERPRVHYGYRIGTLSFLIPGGTGSEVVPLMNPAAIPNSPRWLRGVINLRGALVPVFDLASVLGLDIDQPGDSAHGPGAKPVFLVLDKGDHAAGILIDGFPRPLINLRAVVQLPPLPESLRNHVAAAYADNEAIWLELAHQGLLLELASRVERTVA